jgi:tRNA wybutosine-synthesizing protein 5
MNILFKIMDNVLMQIRGEKRLALFSPSDIQYMYMDGDKSKIIDIDNPDLNNYPLFSKAKRYECKLYPGDFIFIPGIKCRI